MLILASASPRRRELLAEIGLPFEVAPGVIDESILSGVPPVQAVEALALAKARLVAATRPLDVVLGADTAVVLGEEVFGKPIDRADARRMLAALRGRTHEVITGVALVATGGGREAVRSVVTSVTMRLFDDAELERYLDTPEPYDKAGAYAVQGLGGSLVASVEGCYTNVVGLPITTLRAMLREWGLL